MPQRMQRCPGGGGSCSKTPANVSARDVLGLSLVRQGRLAEAEQEYAKSLATDSKQHRVYSALGMVNIQLGKLDEAETLYRKSLELTPEFVEAMVFLGFIEKERGEEGKAEAWYQKALRIDPSFPDAHRRYGDLYFQRAEYAEAMKCYRKTLEVVPHHFQAMNQVGVCAKRMKDYATAEEYFERAERLRPDSWVPVYNFACVRALAGDADAALARLQAAVAKGFRNPGLLKGDEDLASVRPLPGYAELLARVVQASQRAAQRADG